ncbi:MAG: DNA polymerase II [Thalassotalea sp.]
MSPYPASGLLLTRQCHDQNNRLVLTFWLQSAQGPIKLQIDNERALFFVEQNQQALAHEFLAQAQIPVAQIKPLALKTFKHQLVCCFYFNSLKDFYAARELLKQSNIKCYEDDIRPDDRFLMERFITSSMSFTGRYRKRNGYLEVTQGQAKKTELLMSLAMVSIDLECAYNGELFSIGVYSDNIKTVFMIGDQNSPAAAQDYNTSACADNEVSIPEQGTANESLINTITDYISEPTQVTGADNKPALSHYDDGLTIEWLADEKALLQRFIAWLIQYDPDIIIGWNVINFDFDLLQKRCDLHKIPFAIGRDGRTAYWRKNNVSDMKFISISGRVVLDGIDLLKSATYNFSSFSLENVARELLGIGKKVDDVDNRLKEIADNFNNNKIALAKYNLEDCRLVWLIFEKTDLLSFAILRAQLTGLELDRIGGSVAAFTNLYTPKLHRAGYIAPNMGDGQQGFVSPGGYVMNSVPGLYDNVLVLDFKSLYPSIIRTFNIDPMGMIEGLAEELEAKTNEQSLKHLPIKGYDGAYFSREQHFLPDIIKSLWSERDKAKAEGNKVLSQAIKIIMNSFYGILGSTGCRYFDPRLSSSITKRSHDILKTTSLWIESTFGFQVIYGDTDSIFVHLGGEYSQAQCREKGIALQNFINQGWQQHLADDFAITSELEIEFETHFIKFLMPTIRGLDIGTKKRYAGMVKNKQGEQSIIYKGLESVRTDWTELAKQFQRELYHRVFNDLPVKEYVLTMTEKTYAGQLDELLIYRKRIRRKLNEYVKNIPPHIKAARAADEHNLATGKPLRYQNKGWIEYVMTINGPQAKEQLSSAIDHQLYVERQLKAVADAILPFIHTSFDEITNNQLNLF